MMRLALMIFVLALLACGGSDTAQTGGTDAGPAAEAADAGAGSEDEEASSHPADQIIEKLGGTTPE